jgi:hypothetical protein
MFALLFLLYSAGPLILVPLWAYHEGDWWLLVGIAISFLATKLAAQYSRSVFYFLCYCIGFWLRNGFSLHQRTTFYFFCALSGYILWQLADSLRLSSARSALVHSPGVYNEALAQNRLRIVQLDSSQGMMLTPDDITASVTGLGLEPLKPLAPLLRVSNIVAEAFAYTFGLFVAVAGMARAYARGISKLSPRSADSIMRNLKKGTAGVATVTLGYLGIYSVWGLLFVATYACLVLWSMFKASKSSSAT